MNLKIKVTKLKDQSKDDSLLGFATVTFGDSFKLTHVTILKNRNTGEKYVGMPRYKSSEKDEQGNNIYKDVCNPITAEFRSELYSAILAAYDSPEKEETVSEVVVPPEFKVTVKPYEREGSTIRGLARIYLDDEFVINNVNIIQGRNNLFVSMPSYKTKQVDEKGAAIYQDICYPVTKDFREKLYNSILEEYEIAKEKRNSEAMNKASEQKEKSKGGVEFLDMSEDTPLR